MLNAQCVAGTQQRLPFPSSVSVPRGPSEGRKSIQRAPAAGPFPHVGSFGGSFPEGPKDPLSRLISVALGPRCGWIWGQTERKTAFQDSPSFFSIFPVSVTTRPGDGEQPPSVVGLHVLFIWGGCPLHSDPTGSSLAVSSPCLVPPAQGSLHPTAGLMVCGHDWPPGVGPGSDHFSCFPRSVVWCLPRFCILITWLGAHGGQTLDCVALVPSTLPSL